MQSAKWGSGRSSYWPPPVKPVLRLGQQAGRRKKRKAPPQWPAGAFFFPSPFFLIFVPLTRRRRFGGGHFSTGRPVHCYEVSKRAPPLGLMGYCYGLALVNSFVDFGRAEKAKNGEQDKSHTARKVLKFWHFVLTIENQNGCHFWGLWGIFPVWPH